MRDNRGSAAVISIIFMMFLLIVGIGFMPLMNSEVKHASLDMDEQKAWYAAEAGIKYAKAYQTDAKDELQKIIAQAKPVASETSNGSFTLKIKDLSTGLFVADSTKDFPLPGQEYMVYSEGAFNGVKKVITEEFVFAETSSSGGSSGGNATVLPGLIHAKTISISGGNLTGDLYAVSMSGNGYATYNFSTQSAGYTDSLFTLIQASWFPTIEQVKSDKYDKLESVYGDEPKHKIKSNNSYYIDGTSVVDNKGKVNGNAIQKITGESGSIVYVYDGMGSRIQQIVGPGSGVPFTVVLVNSTETVMNVQTYGNVRILASNNLKFSGGQQQNGKIMVLTNGNLTLTGWTVVKGFISANRDISISGGGFTGQIMAKGSVTILNQDTFYNNDVLSDKNFWLPEWLP